MGWNWWNQEDETLEDVTEHNTSDSWEQISTATLQNYIELDMNVMTSEVMDIDVIVDSHIHENLRIIWWIRVKHNPSDSNKRRWYEAYWGPLELL
jgi:hypothetical protein